MGDLDTEKEEDATEDGFILSTGKLKEEDEPVDLVDHVEIDEDLELADGLISADKAADDEDEEAEEGDKYDDVEAEDGW